jgi:adenylosuccinate synthase
MRSVTVVVGGQYGSEGKGKVAQYLAREHQAAAVVRVGGSNSGHTAVAPNGDRIVLRHLPTAAVDDTALCVLAPGSYVQVDALLREVEQVDLDSERLLIDRNAFVITDADRAVESASDLRARIGSTNSGTGAAVARRVARRDSASLAQNVAELEPFVRDTTDRLRGILKKRGRVIIEGTQGFGLSVLHSPFYPWATSRDTSAAGAVSEAGLSPRDVDEIYLVVRAFPIRVAGNSGPLEHELTWDDVTHMSGAVEPLAEYTSVTGALRRVARFDPEIVRRAIAANQPSSLVMNHLDYVDAACAQQDGLTPVARDFVANAARAIGWSINHVGVGPEPTLLPGDLPYALVAS